MVVTYHFFPREKSIPAAALSGQKADQGDKVKAWQRPDWSGASGKAAPISHGMAIPALQKGAESPRSARTMASANSSRHGVQAHAVTTAATSHLPHGTLVPPSPSQAQQTRSPCSRGRASRRARLRYRADPSGRSVPACVRRMWCTKQAYSPHLQGCHRQ
eukprot:scaffold58865_cov20-Tisochrysis_lutea.AAC.1